MNHIALSSGRNRRFPRVGASAAARSIALMLGAVAFLNVALFSIRNADPVIQSDTWYFLDVFISKAIKGTLTFGDFFIKRHGFDHAQPLFKIINLLELYFFNLNFAVGTFIGVLATAAFVLILHRLVFHNKNTGAIRRGCAWVAMCALLFSLNAHGMFWTVPLSAMESITNLVILVFFVAVWRARETGRYSLMAMATLLLAVSSDDSAVLAIVAGTLSLVIIHALEGDLRIGSRVWKIAGIVTALLIIVRVGYAFAPVVGGTAMPTQGRLGDLVADFISGGWWKWTTLPLVLPVAYHSVSPSISTDTWRVLQAVAGVVVLLMHVWFWIRIIHTRRTCAAYVALSLMLLFYGWLAGIVVARVPVYGNGFILQPRYVFLFSTQLIALLLLWADGVSDARSRGRLLGTRSVVAIFGCAIIVFAQIPNSIQSWKLTPYLDAYYHQTALQINDLVVDPQHPPKNCQPWIHVCKWPLSKRTELPRILLNNKLNLYSPKLISLYPYLPGPPTDGSASR